MAHSYRRTTIKITFQAEYARPRPHEIENFIRDDLRLDPRDVIGIHFSITGNVVYVKMRTEELCSDIVNRNADRHKFKHPDGHIGAVVIEHMGYGLRTIRVFELPFEVPENIVTAAFSPYGNVLGHTAEKWKTFETYPVLNGVRQIQIELKKHVPSYLNIGGCRAIIMYDGQPRTCAGCGQEGHVRQHCPLRRPVQTPVNDDAPSAPPTTLPVTYAAATAPTTDHLQDPRNPSPTTTDNVDTTLANETSPQPDAMQEETHQTHPVDHENAKETTLDVVPTSAFIPTDKTAEDKNTLSESEQHTRKQQNPRKRRKKQRKPSDDCLQRMGSHEDDSLSDDGRSSDTQMSEVNAPASHLPTASNIRDAATPSTPTNAPEGVPPAAPPPHAGAADDTLMDTTSELPRSWAEETEVDHVTTPDEEKGDVPMIVSDIVPTQ